MILSHGIVDAHFGACYICPMEKLKSYIVALGMSQNRCAVSLGMLPQAMSMYLQGKRKLSAAEAVKIEDATCGAVTVRDLSA